MPSPRVLDQHIAVFGQSGSGKTVLVSSFYGAMQEPEFLTSSLFDGSVMLVGLSAVDLSNENFDFVA